jgi:hypothetical protein
MPEQLLKGIFAKKLAASLSIAWLLTVICSSQPQVMSFVEAGDNNIYSKGYFSHSIFASYDLNNDRFNTGIIYSFGGERENIFGGYSLWYTRKFSIRQQSFAVSGFYLWVPFSNELRETNWGLTLNYKLPHFRFTLGNNYRTYRFSKAYIKSDQSTSGSYRIIEPGNLMYTFQYLVKKEEAEWNVMLSVTNNDYFMIEQETNPMILLQGEYQFNETLTSFIDIGYKSSGLLCIKVEPFGYFFRIGIKWDI